MSTDIGGELIREALWFDDGFSQLPNTWLRDSKITNQARGLLVQIASHKAGFRISIASLVSYSLNGRDAIQTQLTELQRAGYLSRETFKSGGLKRYRYRLCDPHSPVDNHGQAAFDLEVKPPVSTYPEKPYTGNPYTGKPSTENPDSKELLSKNNSNPVPEVTIERPVDNSTDSPRVQSESAAQSATPDGGSAAVGSPAENYSRLIAAKCHASRSGSHRDAGSGYCLHCGHKVPGALA